MAAPLWLSWRVNQQVIPKVSKAAPATCGSPPPDHNSSTVIYDAVQCLDYQQLAELTDLYLHPARDCSGVCPKIGVCYILSIVKEC
jgi:hypothetical protein